MKSPFNNLNKEDVEKLRSKRSVSNGKEIIYRHTLSDIKDAKAHLMTLYSGNVTLPFAERILLLNDIY